MTCGSGHASMPRMIASQRPCSWLALLVFSLAAFCLAPTVSGDDDVPPAKLVVVVVVDGLMPEQLTRCEDLFVGGLQRLMDEGASLTACHHDHARTKAGPGHFVLLSGRHPGPAGIVDNLWYDTAAQRRVYCTADSTALITGTDRPGGSYRNVSASALGDWLKSESSAAKVFSFAGKDRSAILMGGRGADGVYWFDRTTGHYVTSTYYRDASHGWIDAFNALRRPAGYMRMEWERLLADPAPYTERARADEYAGEEDMSAFRVPFLAAEPVFDHKPANGTAISTEKFFKIFYSFPWTDEVTMDLATEAVAAEELGRDDVPDLLCIGLSALDGVAHMTGPFSQESMDVVLRVDRLLGEFIDFLDDSIGDDAYVMLMSSDHGFCSLPEYAAEMGEPGTRAGKNVKLFMVYLRGALRELCGGVDPICDIRGTRITINPRVLEEQGVAMAQVDSLIRARAADQDWVSRVYSRSELLTENGESDVVTRRMRHSTHPSKSPNFIVLEKPGTIVASSRGGTDHGTPHQYDTHVPAIFIGPGIIGGRYGLSVETIDLAPTLATLLGLESIPEVDGSRIDALLHPSLLPR